MSITSKEIKLEELPKSKEFMKHVKIADGLTSETGLEHGFKFCKHDDEIIVDKMCVGEKCSITVTHEKCKKFADSFHTHPHRKTAAHSVSDIFNSAIRSYRTGKPNIVCVKGFEKNIVNCIKSDIPDQHVMVSISKVYNDYKDGWMSQKETIYKLNDIIQPTQFLFDSKNIGKT